MKMLFDINSKKKIIFNLKKIYFDDIKNGHKTEEFRLNNDYWKKRLINRDYEFIVIKLGYPKKDDYEKMLFFKWNGFKEKSITHKEFGYDSVEVFAIDLSEKIDLNEMIL